MEIERKFLLNNKEIIKNYIGKNIEQQYLDENKLKIEKDDLKGYELIFNSEKEKINIPITKKDFLKINNKSCEYRIRKIDDKDFFFTIKTSGNLEREEIEKKISKNIYNNLSEINIGIINKIRYYIPLKINNLIAEVDIYKNINLSVVEVEFKNKKQAEKFSPPLWFGEEITDNQDYKNKNLLRKEYPHEINL